MKAARKNESEERGTRKRTANPFRSVVNVVQLLKKRERKRLILVIIGAIFMGLIEVGGVGSIMPFMAVAANPKVIQTNPLLHRIYTTLAFHSEKTFLIFLGVTVVVFILITNIAHAMFQLLKVKFTGMQRHSLSLRLLKGYLGQPYPFFLNKNSHELIKNVNNEIQIMILRSLIQFVDIVSRVIQISLLTLFLFIVNPESTLTIIAVLGVLYSSIYTLAKRTIQRLGNERFDLNAEMARIVSEAFWGIKEVKIASKESVFADEYVAPSRKLAKNDAKAEIIGDIPKFILEAIAFSSIISFVLVTILRTGSFQDAAGAVSLFAYAGYRMIPAIQGLFKAFTNLKYGMSTSEKLILEFDLTKESGELPRGSASPLPFSESLELKNIEFVYPNSEKPVLSDINISIRKNELIGFAGKTGSGKTTLIDIILGLLQPRSGTLVIDGLPVDESNIRSWQANIGYVPQNIYLSNDSIAANIAFGVPRGDIDNEAVTTAASMAQIHDFIVSELPNGYGSFVGERGVKLSGGQRQRIGIARALYRNPSVLIMDEATSALDHHTEQAVMDSIDALHGTRTIILIAHRLTTLNQCDRICVLDKGRLIDEGTSAELSSRNKFFSI